MKMKTLFPLASLVLLFCSAETILATIFNVKTQYGAAGNGTTDDTASINNAIVAANTAGGTNTVYFPTGTYLVNNLTISSITDVIFDGDGALLSVLKRKPSTSPQQNRIATITGGSNLTFQEMGFDANGIERYGGLATYTVNTIMIKKVRCFDGAPVGAQNGYDRYMFNLQGCTNVTIQDTLWEDLQIEIDTSSNVDILRNVVKRPRETAGIGIFSLHNGDVHNDYLIQDNWIVDPTMTSCGAIVVSLDAALPGPASCTHTNIQILNNTIIYTNPPVSTDRNPGIKFGVTNSQQSATGNIFDYITVTGNKVYVSPSIADTFARDFIWFHTNYPTVLYDYDHTTVANNTLYYNGVRNCFSIYSAAAKGTAWSESNNVKTAYVTPPIVPNPLGATMSTADGIGADARTRCADSTTNFGAETKLCAGNYVASSGATQKSWFRFDLAAAGITGAGVTSATLDLEFIDSATGNLGANKLNNVYTFNVYGLINGHAGDASPSGWTETGITWANAPGNDTSTKYGLLSSASHGGTYLFSFTRTGKGLGAVSFSSASYPALLSFLQADNNGVVTFMIGRVTGGTGGSGADQDDYIHGIAAKEHATAVEPKLTVE